MPLLKRWRCDVCWNEHDYMYSCSGHEPNNTKLQTRCDKNLIISCDVCKVIYNKEQDAAKCCITFPEYSITMPNTENIVVPNTKIRFRFPETQSCSNITRQYSENVTDLIQEQLDKITTNRDLSAKDPFGTSATFGEQYKWMDECAKEKYKGIDSKIIKDFNLYLENIRKDLHNQSINLNTFLEIQKQLSNTAENLTAVLEDLVSAIRLATSNSKETSEAFNNYIYTDYGTSLVEPKFHRWSMVENRWVEIVPKSDLLDWDTVSLPAFSDSKE